MLSYAALFLIIALIAALFGFGGIAASAAGIAQVLFWLFLIPLCHSADGFNRAAFCFR
jgi:uncharacterized membrane protein YtjA (UPF0391 family)